MDHAVHAGGACSRTLAGCTQAWPQTGIPARWAASVSRRTDTESSWAYSLSPIAPASRAWATTCSGSSSGLNMIGVHPSCCMAIAGGCRIIVPRAVATAWKPLKKNRRPATSCMATTRGAAWSARARGSRTARLVPMSRTVVTPWASSSRRSSASLPRRAVHHEQQVDVRVDQSGDEILALGVDHAGVGGHRALAGRAGADHSVAADHGDRVGDLAAAGPVPQGGADDGHGGHQRHWIAPGEPRASAGCGGQRQTAQSVVEVRETQHVLLHPTDGRTRPRCAPRNARLPVRCDGPECAGR